MKFEYVGQDGFKDLDLVIWGIMKPYDILNKGFTFNVPDENKTLIEGLMINGNYRKVSPVKTNKKNNKGDD